MQHFPQPAGLWQRHTLRSTFERMRKIALNSGSVSMVRHFPAPCLTTPAFNAASSSAVHFCLGAPIEGKVAAFYDRLLFASTLEENGMRYFPLLLVRL